ncbi:MAG: transcriptional repressor [Actinomycetaceae bacterium]|nr:transcriptional repressor [Actinomycetaceae bacterium]
MSTGKRNTRQRQLVIDALKDSGEFRSAQTIHMDMVANGEKVGLATVYRNLRSLAEDGSIDMLMAPDGESLYRRCDLDGHHHHLVCRNCRKSIEVTGKEMESLLDALVAKYGFSDLEHSLEIFGLCPQCQRAGAGES